MDAFFEMQHWILGLVILVGCLGAVEAGYRLGIGIGKGLDKDDRGVVDTIVASILGLVALLIGFTFAMAGSRYEARRQLVLEEANAVGTAVLRTELIPADIGDPMRAQLRQYVRNRLEYFNAAENSERMRALEAEAERIHGAIWAGAVQLSKETPSSYSAHLMTMAINDVIDTAGKRVSALTNHVPLVVWVLVLGTVMLAMMGLGFRCGLAQRRLIATTTLFAVVISLTVFVVIDLDRPRKGLIRVSQGAMLDLQRSMDSEGGGGGK